MAQVKIRGQGGSGSKINGIIEEYKVASSGNVNAGDFVKFVNVEIGANTQLTTEGNLGYRMSAILLDDDRVFITYSSASTLYGMICTIGNNTITAGIAIQLIEDNILALCRSVILIDTDKVFIAYSISNKLYGIVCTTENNTITAGISTQLSTQNYSGVVASAVLLENNKIIIAHSYDSNYYLYGLVCTIENTTITIGTDTRLAANSYVQQELSATLLNNNRIFITYIYKNNTYYHIYGMVCTTENTEITVETNKIIYNDSGLRRSGDLKAVLLDNDKVFIMHSSSSMLYGIVCTTENNTITVGEDTQLIGKDSSPTAEAKIILLDVNRVFIIYRRAKDDVSYLFGLNCIIVNMSILVDSNVQLSEINQYQLSVSINLLNNSKILVLYNDKTNYSDYSNTNNYNIYGIICFNSIDKTNRGDYSIIGIAKTKGTAGQTAKVIVPNKEGE